MSSADYLPVHREIVEALEFWVVHTCGTTDPLRRAVKDAIKMHGLPEIPPAPGLVCPPGHVPICASVNDELRRMKIVSNPECFVETLREKVEAADLYGDPPKPAPAKTFPERVLEHLPEGWCMDPEAVPELAILWGVLDPAGEEWGIHMNLTDARQAAEALHLLATGEEL